MQLLQDGGPLFMYTLLTLLFITLALIVKGLLKKDYSKTIKLVSSISLFALVFGLLGQVIGLITAFDSIQSFSPDGINPGVLAGGLKISFLTTSFGFFVFLVGRAGIIIMTWLEK